MIGILIGVEREHRKADHEVFAGVRTFAIACVSGMLATFVGTIIGFNILLIAAVLIVLCGVALIYRTYTLRGRLGLTNVIALYCTFLLGILVANSYYLFAIITGVIITFLLVEKRPLHSFAQKLTDDELLSALRFLAVAFILYPLVPSEPVWGIINLKSTIFIIVLVMFIGFVSYLSLRRVGTEGGIAYSGLLGGFVSSDATVAALSGLAKEKTGLINSFYKGVLLATLSMLISNLVIAFIVDTSGRTAYFMAPPHILMGIALAALFILGNNKDGNVTEQLELKSPFALKPAFEFGIIFLGLQLIGTFASEYAGIYGVYALAIGGVVSSSAVTASLAALAVNGSLSYATAAQIAVIAGIISILNKIVLIRMVGTPELERKSRLGLLILAAVGIAALFAWMSFAGNISF
ncbi:uncharacterized membrane protein (DUF4010 family) [Methanohalophilus levihalophilus]|uniref:MgtC/SapB family protein n=1 Tax=Methanohalophilus levihalophilus TaxID=1431282 RepID=UPI001AE1494D|nr:uncharacterized membrane protein (DUF4010 family) [Methanohalophilus levihalophilus]